MSFFEENAQFNINYNSLPENVRNEIRKNSEKIKSADELNELVRRIQSAKSGRIF